MKAATRLLRIFALLAGPALVLITVTWLTQPHGKPAARAALPSHAVPTTSAVSGAAVPASPQARPGATPSPAPASPVGPHEAGMVVGIDPETGKLGPPTAEQRAELEQISASQNALLSHSSAGLVEEHRADGTVHVNLQGRFQEYATVRIGPDGKKTFDCVDDTTGVSKNASRSAPTGASAGATAAPATAAPALEER